MRTLTVTLLFSILFAGSPVYGQETQTPDYVPGVVLVKFEKRALPEVSQTVRPQGLVVSQAVSVLDSVGFTRGKKLFENFMPSDTVATTRSGERTRLIDISRWYKLGVNSDADIPRLADRLERLPGIASASPNHIMSVRSTTPDDPEFQQGNQWGLSNQGVADADIHAPAAWDKNMGRSDVVVGVIDTGIDYNHDDLDPGDRSRVIQGRDFGEDDSDAMDEAGHGTGVAGAIGAITDNNRQVAGVMWNLQLMPLKATDSYTGGITTTLAAEALDHARTNGVDIVNMSFSQGPCGGFLDPDCFKIDQLRAAVANAYLQGLTLLSSTGNNGNREPHTPALYWGTAAVGGSDPDDSRDLSSTYGPHVNFVAPSGFQSTDLNNGTQKFGGPTSHATAIASGVAGLILSESRDLGLGLTNDDIRHLMEKTAKDINSGQFPGPDERVGHGRINANAALEALQPPNDVIHASHTGGSSQKIDNDRKQVFFDNTLGSGLAGGTYFVDVYEVTGHVNFSAPFQNGAPMVWIRERSTKGWSNDDPDDQRPWVKITNVTQSGFDYKTFVYDVVSNMGGQYIGWKPTSPSNVKIAYTAVGEQGTAPLDVTLSGPTWRDNGEQGTWTASVSGGSGSPSYDWEYQSVPSSTGWYSPYCSGTSCSHTFFNYSSSQVEQGKIRVTVTKGSGQDQASLTVNVNPAGGYYSSVAKRRAGAFQSLDASADGGGAAEVRWSTRGPLPAAEFVIEHRRDSTAAWTKVGRVAAADSVGTADRRRGASYRYRADDLSVGTHQFRLQVQRKGAKKAFSSRPIAAEIRLKEAYEVTTYPNPVRTQTTVEVAVKEQQPVSVSVYDVLGRKVTTLHDGPLPAQNARQFTLDASEVGLSSGTYFVRVRGKAFADTRRLTVVR